MNSPQLADEVTRYVEEARGRILGVGKDQYSTGARDEDQRFETYPYPKLLDMFREELLDQINYAVMSLIRLDRHIAALQGDKTAKPDIDATLF